MLRRKTLAILHTSIYDAVNGITRTHEPYLVTLRRPSEWIYLLNPAHGDFEKAVHRRREIDVVLDPRLWT